MVAKDGPDMDLTALLCRGLSRLAVAAEGNDSQLDLLLAELRHLLRGDLRDRDRLARVIDAIEQRIKAIDETNHLSAQALQAALERLLAPLLAHSSERALQNELLALKRALAELTPGSLPLALDRVADAQQQLLGRQAPQRVPFWGRLFGRDEPIGGSAEPVVAPSGNDGPPASLGDEISDVLQHLLRQIDVPAVARDNHRQVVMQLERGLSAGEIVPTLQEVSVIVLTALEHDRGEFQRFLLALNQRLVQTQETVQITQREQSRRREADAALHSAVRDGVDALQHGVQRAESLEQLQGLVSSRLDAIVTAVEVHRREETLRQQAVQAELERLTQRLLQLEAESVQAEQRMAEQRKLALLDMLTQLPNRQAFDERLQQALARAPNPAGTVLAVCAIDGLAAINERYGQLAGDKVLRVVGRTLRARMRRADCVARLGGAEFVLLFADLSAEAALAQVEMARDAVASCPFHFREQPVAVTLSAGLARAAPQDDGPALLRRAEENLRLARADGGNRCEPAAAVTAVAI